MKIGFIGCGNMATAIIKGILNAKVIEAENVNVFDVDTAKVDALKNERGIVKADNAKAVATNSDFVILAVKPNVLRGAIEGIDDEIKGKVLVSIAAGKTISFIEESLTHENKIIRIMPNINAKVSEACSAYCTNSLVEKADTDVIETLFSAVGTITPLDESMFPLFGVIAGCAPAFSYMFIDALARAGVENGMAKSVALKFAAQTVYGSAKMVLEDDAHPYELIDRVCSPGGTTIEGVVSLQQDGFESAVHNAVNKAVEKDKKL